jgi:hypothetical protein
MVVHLDDQQAQDKSHVDSHIATAQFGLIIPADGRPHRPMASPPGVNDPLYGY